MFFTDRLAQQRQASPRTIAAYRDALKLLLEFIHARTGKLPSKLDWDDLDATMISGFLNHLETTRGNSIRTRNVRLTAIRSLFAYAALRHPEYALLIQRVLAIPPKRFDKRIVTFLTPPEIDAIVAAPDKSRWEGRRDRALILLAIQTGLRVSELTGLNCADVTLGTGAKPGPGGGSPASPSRCGSAHTQRPPGEPVHRYRARKSTLTCFVTAAR
ncbi:tyrosine-type recombinase/integrase [Arthrobacter sp. PsM3]|uniref:tyrosine-type recombinase/integrase n=1 Tax=Arthrobacter sp. PsM3 TaxID=3030531 RepID=UPI00263BDE95|nr:site-specific integrase [Arthrobacter sp. PsM3]MDN4645981.1 site-specific integrase [Arthrobacter sp. PsM3]